MPIRGLEISILLILFALTSQSFAQQNSGATNQPRSRLDDIRREIRSYRNRISNEARKEEKILQNLEQLDREIDLIHELIAELKKEERQKLRTVESINEDIDTKQDELTRLQGIYKKRIVTFYKYGRFRDLELLFASRSFNQTLVLFRYLKLIADTDRRNYQNLLKKKQFIESKKEAMKKELIAKRAIINEKTAESKRLAEKVKQRNQLLSKVQQNKKIYLEKLAQYEASAKEVQRLIVLEERKRLQRENQGIVEISNFPSLKGKMIWPTQGFVISHFGRHRHPKWKTITENIGVDIKAEFGEDVRAVASGVVTAITWQRGRGNIVIINHRGGYFSVYTHLSQILVQIDEKVKLGQVIGNVGDTGSLQGPMLHFEIWKSNRALDPEDWLS